MINPELGTSAHRPALAVQFPLGGTKKAKTMNKLLDASEKQKAVLSATHYENPWLEAASESGNDLGRLLKFVKGKPSLSVAMMR
jgi:hypothetical protein